MRSESSCHPTIKAGHYIRCATAEIVLAILSNLLIDNIHLILITTILKKEPIAISNQANKKKMREQ